MTDLFRPSTAPLHLRVLQELQIRFASLPPLSPVPSERDLCAELNVSRTTIRKTLAELERRGDLNRLPGKGTFTADRKYVDHELQWFIGFHEDARQQNKRAQTRVIRQAVQDPNSEICQVLEIAPQDKVFVLERLRFIEGEAMCLVSAYIPLSVCPELIQEDFSNVSLYEFLRSRNISTVKARRSIEVKTASEGDALYLAVPPASPILLFESIGYTLEERPFEFVRSRYPAFKARFESEVFNPRLEG